MTVQNSRKNVFFLFQPICNLSFLSHQNFDFLHSNFNRKHVTSRRKFNWKNVDFQSIQGCGEFFNGKIVNLCSLPQSVDRPNTPKKVLCCFNSLNCKIWKPQPLKFWVPPSKFNPKHNNKKWAFEWKTVDSVRCIRILIVQFFHKTPLPYRLSPISNPTSFVNYNYRLCFFFQGVNQKIFSCGNIVDGIIVDFIPCIGIPTHRYS